MGGGSDARRVSARVLVLCLVLLWVVVPFAQAASSRPGSKVAWVLASSAVALGFGVFASAGRICRYKTGHGLRDVSNIGRAPAAVKAGFLAAFFDPPWWRRVVIATRWPRWAVTVALVGALSWTFVGLAVL